MKKNYINLLKKEKKAEPKIYVKDGKGIPTIGYGRNLKANSDLIKDLNRSDISDIQIKNFNDLLPDLKDERKSISEKDKLVEEYYKKDANETIILTQTDMDKLFKIDVDDKKKVVENKLGTELYDELKNSNEMIALVSLAYNGGSGIIGSNLKNALENGNRVAAWYEIRFQSNADRLIGLQDRRNEESEYFGLFKDKDNITQDEAIEAIKFFNDKKDEIDSYLKSLCHINGKNERTKITDSELKAEQSKLKKQLYPAKELLASQYLKDELKFEEKDKKVEEIIKKHMEQKRNAYGTIKAIIENRHSKIFTQNKLPISNNQNQQIHKFENSKIPFKNQHTTLKIPLRKPQPQIQKNTQNNDILLNDDDGKWKISEIVGIFCHNSS